MEIGIIGAGASGLMAAVNAAASGIRVRLLEHNDLPGRKILATGNGKCNFTNMNLSPQNYYSKKGSFVSKVLDIFSNIDSINFFKNLGIEPFDKNGYVYPTSQQASSIQQALLYECRRLGAEIINECSINDIMINKYRVESTAKVKDISESKTVIKNTPLKKYNFTLSTNRGSFYFDRLIIAAGLKAAPVTGSDGSILEIIKRLGYKIITPLPALCPLFCENKRFFKKVSGVRVRAELNLFINDKFVFSDIGEVQLTDYGISGIPAFQLARFVSKALSKGEKTELSMNFLYFVKNQKEYFKKRVNMETLEELAMLGNGLLNKKLWLALLSEAKLSPSLKTADLSSGAFNALFHMLVGFKFRVVRTADFDKAQVCCGGVDLSQIEPCSMESRLHKDLYFAGEIMDIDGMCGGYNLQWAWASGYIAGKSAGGALKKV